MLKADRFEHQDYAKIATFIDYDINYLKTLNVNLIKEVIINYLLTLNVDSINEVIYKKKQKNNINSDKFKLSMQEVLNLSESECGEKLKLNKDFSIEEIPSYKILKTTNKCNLALSLLNSEQLDVVYYLCENISCTYDTNGKLVSPNVYLLDAPGGTGKSYLIDCLTLCMAFTDICVICKNKTLLANIATLSNQIKELHTICKFLMIYFNLEFTEAINLFKNIETEHDFRTKVDMLLDSKRPWNFNLLVIDEYSLESPLFLALMVIAAKRENVNILFLGDIKQQNTLAPSLELHPNNNYALLSKLKGVKIYELNQQMRIKDDKLKNIINILRSHIGTDVGNVVNTFHIKYKIFEKLLPKFLKQSKLLEDVYLTDRHLSIKGRINTVVEFAKKKHKVCYKSYYTLVKKDGTEDDKHLILPENDKFHQCIHLIEGCTYIHNKKFVILKKIHETHLECINENGNTVDIKKVFWTAKEHECVDQNYKWLCNNFDVEDYNILQYPLRPILLTYHYVQGLTFNKQTISIDLDAAYINSLYVGFSRVQTLEQITNIESSLFINFVYTMYKNDEYYYKLPATTSILDELCKYIKDRTYKFDDSMLNFNDVERERFDKSKNKRYIRTRKRYYNSVKRKHTNDESSSKLLEIINNF